MLHQELDWLASSLSGRLVIMVPSVFSWLFGIFLYVISVILFARDWVSFRELLKKLPFAFPVSRAGKRVSSALKNWVHGQVRIMFIVALECAVGFWLLRIPGAGLWAVLIGFVDALPVFGTGTVFLPWILLILLQENWTFALWLFLLYGITWLTREESGSITTVPFPFSVFTKPLCSSSANALRTVDTETPYWPARAFS